MKKYISLFTLLFIAFVGIIGGLAVCPGSESEIQQAGAGAGLLLGSQQRAVYDALKRLAPGSKGVMQTGEIRVEAILLNDQFEYIFRVKKDELSKDTSLIQRGLDDNDAFLVTHIGLTIDGRLKAEPSRAELQTFPNNTHFVSGPSGMTSGDERDLMSVYNTELIYRIDQTDVDQISTRKFLNVPNAEQSATTDFSETSFADSIVTLLGFHPISGKANQEYRIKIQNFSGIKLAATSTTAVNVLGLHLYGIKLKNQANTGLLTDLVTKL